MQAAYLHSKHPNILRTFAVNFFSLTSEIFGYAKLSGRKWTRLIITKSKHHPLLGECITFSKSHAPIIPGCRIKFNLSNDTLHPGQIASHIMARSIFLSTFGIICMSESCNYLIFVIGVDVVVQKLYWNSRCQSRK